MRIMVQGKRRDMGLGSCPTISLKEARDKAFQYRKIAREGGDPFAARDKANTPVPTFMQAAVAVHREHSPSWKNQKHSAQWIDTLPQYVFPVFGDSRVDATAAGNGRPNSAIDQLVERLGINAHK